MSTNAFLLILGPFLFQMADKIVATSRKSRGKQCSVYGCFNFAFLQNGVSSGIHFFHVPKAVLSDKKQKDRWCNLIKRQDGRDGFSMNNHTVICDKHFKKEDINISMGTKRWSLKPGSEPSIFDWSCQESRRKSPRKRLLFTPSDAVTVDSETEGQHVYFCEPLLEQEVNY